MWSDLEKEMSALKRECFSKRYNKIRRELKESVPPQPQQWKEFQSFENTYLHLISHVATSQDPDGWWGKGEPFQVLMTAHVVRLFTKMGVSLKDRWHVSKNRSEQGNLYLATKKLIQSFHKPTAEKQAMWGDDIWDDCYILLALLGVKSQLSDDSVQGRSENLDSKFDKQYTQSINWLGEQVEDGLKIASGGGWFGPGFFAATIELFDHPVVKKSFKQSGRLIDTLVAHVKPMLEERVRGRAAHSWSARYAWHIGQMIAIWKQKCPQYRSLKALKPLMENLYEELKARQSPDGTWDNKGKVKNEEYKIYYTVRALAACYLWEKNPAKSLTIRRAQQYLLDAAQGDTPLVDLKGCINAIDALDKLFDFTIPTIYLNLLVAVTHRLDSIGLLKTFLNPEQEKPEVLKSIRAIARGKLEEMGESALEITGVNDRLYQSLSRNKSFLNEFTVKKAEATVSEYNAIDVELRKFLSSTMTEIRSNASHRLISMMWNNNGYLNFIPLLEHLSDLEQDRAFFKFYRDHLNHEVLLFLLGAYIYYNSPVLKEALNEEIKRTYEGFPARLNQNEIENEFLFRWKMVSTFHDIGYLFEVDPDDAVIESRDRGFKLECAGASDAERSNGASAATKRTERSSQKQMLREELLEKSFGVIEAVRRNFLFDYFMQYIKEDQRIDDKDERRRAREEKACRLVSRIKEKSYEEYEPEIERIYRAEDLFKLLTAENTSDAFNPISRYIQNRNHIGRNLIRNYFDLCRTTDSKGDLKRSKFLDHGIMSALVLLKTADMQRFHVKQLTRLGIKGELKNVPELLKILTDEKTEDHVKDKQFYIRFSHVAGAIALHNIYPHLYTRRQCRSFDAQHRGAKLEEAFYMKSLADKGRYAISVDGSPLAYLTALADVLQNWDRHSFRRPTFAGISGEPLTSCEVVIEIDSARYKDHKIHVTPLTEEAKKHYSSLEGNKGFDQYLLGWREYVKIEGIKQKEG